MLGLVVPDCSNPFFAEFALEIERVATSRGVALVMANSNSDPDLEARLIVDLAARQVDGLIVAGAAGPPRPRAPGDRRLSSPTVYIDSALPVQRRLSNNWLRTLVAARAGRDPSVGRPRAPDCGVVDRIRRSELRRRSRGAAEALRAADRQDGPLVRAPFTREGGYQGGLRLLDLRPRPTAVFVSNGLDLQAIGLLHAAHMRGVRVPEDLAIVAFDGTKESEYCWPPVTSARQRVPEMAAAAVRTILDHAGNAPTHQVFQIDLVLRRSCGCSEPVAGTPSKTKARIRS